MNDTAKKACKNKTREEFLNYAQKIKITDNMTTGMEIC